MPQKFDAYVFDLDGTLIDTLSDLVSVTNKALAIEGYPEHTREEILSYVGDGPRALIARAVPVGTSDALVERVFAQWRNLHEKEGIALSQPYPHVAEALARLKACGCKLAVLSNKFDEGVHQVMDAKLPGMFDLMYGERPDIPRKPDPAGLLRVVAELGVMPERCAYVGDSPSDVLVARRAGVYSVAVTWGYRTPDEFVAEGIEPDCWIDDMLELVPLEFAPLAPTPR